MAANPFPRILLHDYGGYAFTYQAAQSLAARGYPVSYVYSDTTQFIKRNPGAGSANLSSVGVQLSKPFQKYSFIKRREQEIEHGRRVVEEIERFRPDVVISADTPLDAQSLIYSSSRKAGAGFVFWLQDVIGLATHTILSNRYPLVGNVIGQYYIHLERRLLRQSDRVILISEDFYPLLDAWGLDRRKLHVIPNWAPVEEICPQPKENPWSRQHDLADKLCFLYSGILGLKHNPALFVALAKSLVDFPQARVVVIAEGPGADWLREQKAALGLENLLVLDYQPYEVFPNVLASADVLVAILGKDAGSYSVPSKVLTYLCAGRPILLAVPLENLSARIVQENQAGLVAAPDDEAGFTAAAARFLLEPNLRYSMANNGLRYAQINFNIDQITTRFERIIC